MTNIRDHWIRLITELALNPNPDRMISSGIKYFTDITFEIPGEDWIEGFPITLGELAYEGRSTKISQLSRNYLNKGEIKVARDKLIERAKKKSGYTSVAISMRGEDKDSRSQGHCILNMVISNNPKNYTTGKPELTITLYYRSTEVIKKFGADLIFLHDVVIPQILVEPYFLPQDISKIRFCFSNIYFSPLFLPIMVPQMDVLSLLVEVSETQPYEALRGCYNSLMNLTVNPEDYSYRSRRHMCQFLQDAVGEDKFKYIDLLNKIRETHPKLREVPE